jgi:RimJ/RimL family protein N-acetyltransferase
MPAMTPTARPPVAAGPDAPGPDTPGGGAARVPAVALAAVDEDVLDALLATAVADAEPDDVMAPVPGPPGWTEARRAAFAAYHRACRTGIHGPQRQATWAVVADGAVVGAARLARTGPGTLEAGVWLGRSSRGRGIGTALLPLLVAEARALGATTLVAETTAGNAGALAALRRNGAVLTAGEGDRVHAEVPLR